MRQHCIILKESPQSSLTLKGIYFHTGDMISFTFCPKPWRISRDKSYFCSIVRLPKFLHPRDNVESLKGQEDYHLCLALYRILALLVYTTTILTCLFCCFFLNKKISNLLRTNCSNIKTFQISYRQHYSEAEKRLAWELLM